MWENWERESLANWELTTEEELREAIGVTHSWRLAGEYPISEPGWGGLCREFWKAKDWGQLLLGERHWPEQQVDRGEISSLPPPASLSPASLLRPPCLPPLASLPPTSAFEPREAEYSRWICSHFATGSNTVISVGDHCARAVTWTQIGSLEILGQNFVIQWSARFWICFYKFLD